MNSTLVSQLAYASCRHDRMINQSSPHRYSITICACHLTGPDPIKSNVNPNEIPIARRSTDCIGNLFVGSAIVLRFACFMEILLFLPFFVFTYVLKRRRLLFLNFIMVVKHCFDCIRLFFSRLTFRFWTFLLLIWLFLLLRLCCQNNKFSVDKTVKAP